ncbi:glutathione S-transferase [Halomonas vilamensis]|uniref:Glutathione S-transferase n=1 Tax=Vreelandella vilamensis TaxID=531309 RepID=A0ABU1H516_9GAMM|nr:glutathione S-transferase [Halomonas vilamensis]MDR5899399.1 glutathione S-transferase [Halomonas vilamensis]
MIHVHYLEKSRAHRILWLLETLALEYEIITYPRDSKTQLAPDSLKRVHPLGKSPVITDGDITVAESGAIIDYLLSRYGEGRCQPGADETAEWVNYRYWMHYAEGSLMPLLVMRLVFAQLPKQSPWLIKPIAKGINATVNQRFIAPQLNDHLAMIESHLRTRQQFSTAWPSGADVQMSFPLQALSMSQSLKHYPATAAFVARIDADLGWQRVVERVGPLTLPG